MHRIIKNLLGIVGIVVILMVTVAVGIGAYAYVKSGKTTSVRTFTVNGEGKVTAVPDVAEITFSVITENGVNIGKLQKENTEKVNRALEFLKDKGVATEDIRTQSYNVNPRHQYSQCFRGPCPPPKVVGYTVSQSVLVKVRDFSKIGEFLAGVVEHGANSVSGLSFTIDKPEKVENEARAQAIAEAKEKAEVMAKAGNFKIGKLISIQEGGSPIFPLRKSLRIGPEALEAGFGGEGPPPTIEPGSQEVVVNVTLQYEIK